MVPLAYIGYGYELHSKTHNSSSYHLSDVPIIVVDHGAMSFGYMGGYINRFTAQNIRDYNTKCWHDTYA